MSTIINDDRFIKGKMGGSRQRFLNRNKKAIKRAVQDSFQNGGITNNGEGGIDVVLPKKDISEPSIAHSNTGRRTKVLPGNKEFNAGDRLKRPPGGGGGGGDGDASPDGEGEDDFTFHLSEEEYYNVLFEDLELPNYEERGEQKSDQTETTRAGIASEGTPNNLNLVLSMQKKIGRRFAYQGGNNDRILELWKSKLTILNDYNDNALVGFKQPEEGVPTTKGIEIHKIRNYVLGLLKDFDTAAFRDFQGATTDIDTELSELESKNKQAGSWNEIDLRYRSFDQKPINVSKAVMFCLMDVSASMDQETKNNAKLFYIYLYRFLKKHYDKTDVVFIRYHSEAKECDEEEFFYGRETGGTIVSTGLEKMSEIMVDRYPKDEWNIYGAQASDGDNWGNDDCAKCAVLMEGILKQSQGHWYTEITKNSHQKLWSTYEKVAADNPNKFWMGHVEERRDIPKVFREFFKKRGEKTVSINAFAPPKIPSLNLA